MANLVITATSVVKGAGASIDSTHVWGETVTAGQVVYLNSDNKFYLANSDAVNGTALKSGVGTTFGVALNGGAINQAAFVQTGGQVTIGATLLVGVWYYLSNTGGGICPVADLGTGDWSTILGYGSTVALMTIQPTSTGLQLA